MIGDVPKGIHKRIMAQLTTAENTESNLDII